MRRFVLGTLPVALMLAFPAAHAAPAPGGAPKMYGAGLPFTVDDLPPGALRARLHALPVQARERALNWLRGFGFPAADADLLRVDDDGGVFYADDAPAPAPGADAADTPVAQAIDPAAAFRLHSRPGAARVLYLDFDGHVVSGTAWNANGGASVYDARPFSTDTDEANFSDAERQAIAEIWHRVAEDYAPFDVDVTTEEPAGFTATTGRILVTPNSDKVGTPMPSQSAGGVAYVNVFGSGNYAYYSPAFVYSNQLGPNFAPYIAEAASHEAGHNLGLSHDGTSSSGYYGGHGSGAVSWAPIMGAGYDRNVTQWSRGEYAGANNTQDDLVLIGGKLAFRPDDHGDAPATASMLIADAAGAVTATTPESDPFETDPDNKGVIDSAADVDVFAFNAGAGAATLTVKPAWAAYPRTSGGRGANLDVRATLYDAAGQVVAQSDPLDETLATVSVSLAGGAYYLAVSGVGNSVSPYPDYASLGRYFINGVIPVAAADATAPQPDPMGWAVAPAAGGPDRIAMTAATASDESGAVQYFFDCVSGGAGCVASGWSAAPAYTATGLTAATSYSWRVKARDLAGNETGWSGTLAATTEAAPPPPAPPAAPSGLTAVGTPRGKATLNWVDNSGNETGFRVQRQSFNSRKQTWSGTTVVATLAANTRGYVDAPRAGAYRYRIEAYNNVGSTFTGWVEVTVVSAKGATP